MSNHTQQAQERREAILAFIAAYRDELGYAPTFREIGEAINVESTSMVSWYLRGLKRAGLIDYRNGLPRSITLLDQAEPGNWESGIPEPTETPPRANASNTKGNAAALDLLSRMAANDAIPARYLAEVYDILGWERAT